MPGHVHGVSYHAAKDLWVASFGDSFSTGSYTRILVSDDDGDTWDILGNHEVGYTRLQPVGFCDVGDPTRILCGSDTSWQLFWLNLETGSYDSIITSLRPRSCGSFIFDIVRKDGITYAFTKDNFTQNYSPQDHMSYILVSKDNENWAVWSRLDYEFTGAKYGAIDSNGLMHLNALNTINYGYESMILEIPEISTIKAMSLQPAVTNILSETESTLTDTTMTGWSSTDRTGLIPNTGRSDGNAIKYEKTVYITNPMDPLDATYWKTSSSLNNSQYSARIGVKCSGDFYRVQAQMRFYDNEASPQSRSGAVHYYPLKAGWNDILIPSEAGSSGDEKVGIYFKLEPTKQYETSCEFLIDYIQISESKDNPDWYIGGDSRESDKLTGTAPVDSAFTHIMCVRPQNFFDHYGGDKSIRTYSTDEDNYASVVYDADNSNIELRVVSGGVTGTPASIPVDHFTRNSDLWITVRHKLDGTGNPVWVLNLINGQPITEPSTGQVNNAINGPDLTDTDVDFSTKSDIYSTVLSHDLIADRWYDSYINDTNIEDEIYNIVTDGLQPIVIGSLWMGE